VVDAGRRARSPSCRRRKWADKYKGKFDDGWDAYQQRVFEKQKAMGWIPPTRSCRAAPGRHAAWEDIPEKNAPSRPG
jgi:hypothetical protein